MTKIVFNLLSKKFVMKMFSLITLQQVLIAMGTAALALAGQSLHHPKLFLAYISAFLILSILPHAVTVLLRKTEMQGYFSAYYQFIQLRLLNLSGSARLWPQQNKKEEFLTAIGPEAETYLTAVAFSIFDIFLYVLTIALNILAISLVVDSQFIWAFAASAVLSFLVFQKLSPSLEDLLQKEQDSKMSFLGYLLKSWDNVFLNNKQIHHTYREKIHQHYTKTHQLIGDAHARTESLVLVLTILSSLPVFLVILFLMKSHLNDATYLAGLMVTIPKQISILSNFRAFFQQITNLNSFKLRFRNYWENSQLAEVPLEARIQFQKIQLDGTNLGAVAGLIEKAARTTTGRHLITGDNGAGKSTLLVHLNSIFENSFFLPANPQLEIGESFENASTGEKLLKHLDFIAQNPPPVLLLDEWDANLDETNREKTHHKIEELARHCLVIEVRHRISGT